MTHETLDQIKLAQHQLIAKKLVHSISYLRSSAGPELNLSPPLVSCPSNNIAFVAIEMRERRTDPGIQSGDSVASSSKRMLERDGYFRREPPPDFSEHGFPVFALLGSSEIVQKLNLDDGPAGCASWLKGLPERRIGRWNYTIVPWED